MEGGLLMDVAIAQRASTVFQLLARKNEALPVWSNNLQTQNKKTQATTRTEDERKDEGK